MWILQNERYMPRRDLFIWFGWRLLVLGQCQQQSSLSVGQLKNDWLTDKYSLVIGLSVCLCVVTVLCKECHLVSRYQLTCVLQSRGISRLDSCLVLINQLFSFLPV